MCLIEEVESTWIKDIFPDQKKLQGCLMKAAKYFAIQLNEIYLPELFDLTFTIVFSLPPSATQCVTGVSGQKNSDT